MEKLDKMNSSIVRLRSHFAALGLALVVFSSASHCQQQGVINIDPSRTFQQIEGFGASGAWWAQIVGGWQAAKRRRIVDMLYSPEGVAMSIYRYNVGAGSGREIRDPWRRAETFEVTRGEYDWSRDKSAVRILKDVCDHGVDKRRLVCQ